MEIVISPSKKSGSIKNVVASLNGLIDELNIQSKLLDMEKDRRSYFACQVTAYEDNWTYAQRRRRSAKRKLAAPECNNLEDSKKLNQVGEPWLVCDLLVDKNLKKSDDNEEIIRITFFYKEGKGGKMALADFRQYLSDRLNVEKVYKRRNVSHERKEIKKDC